MPADVLYPGWRDSNRGTKYPFAESATLASDAGATLPPGVIIDAALYPPGASAGLHLGGITATPRAVTLTVRDGDAAEVASGTFSVADPPADGVVALATPAGRPAGVLVCDRPRMAALAALGPSPTFRPAATEFVASAAFPAPPAGVTGFLLPDGTVVAGEVWFVGGDGVVLLEDDASELRPPGRCAGLVQAGTVRVHVVGDPLFRRRLCAPDHYTTPRFVRAVRFVDGFGNDFTCGPGPGGAVGLSVDNDAGPTALRIVPSARGLSVYAAGVADGGET